MKNANARLVKEELRASSAGIRWIYSENNITEDEHSEHSTYLREDDVALPVARHRFNSPQTYVTDGMEKPFFRWRENLQRRSKLRSEMS